MTTFDQREDAFEKQFAHDEELVFKAKSRRNHALGEWAAGLLGKTGSDAETYTLAIIALGVEGGGDQAIVDKLHADLSAAGVNKSDHQIRREMDERMATAQREVRTA